MHLQTILKALAKARRGEPLKGYYHLLVKHARFYGIDNKEVLCPLYLFTVTVMMHHNNDPAAIEELNRDYRELCKDYIEAVAAVLSKGAPVPTEAPTAETQ